jgi:uncharacterized membrane protein YfcA
VTYFLVSLSAFVAGMLNAVAGGGTFFTFPALTGIAHLTEKVANMTSTIGLVPGTAASVLAARADFRRIPRNMVILYGIISVIGGILGAILLRLTSTETFLLVIPWLLLFATLVFAFSRQIGQWAGHQHGHKSLKWTLIVCVIQLLVAIYGGYFGAGIGILMLAGLSFSGLENIYEMNALKVLLSTIINAVAAVIFLFSGIDWPIAILMAIASSAGGFLGITVARRVPQAALRGFILTVATCLTMAYFYKAYR